MQKLLLTLILGSSFFTHHAAMAQVAAYPNHQIKIISPFATGGIADGFEVAGGLVGDAGNIIGDGVKYLTGDKIREGERKADRLAKQAEADAAAARLRQANERAAQLRTKAANEEAGEGSSIILGGKNKKKKGSKVSSGMGLSTGDTGLQV